MLITNLTNAVAQIEDGIVPAVRWSCVGAWDALPSNGVVPINALASQRATRTPSNALARALECRGVRVAQFVRVPNGQAALRKAPEQHGTCFSPRTPIWVVVSTSTRLLPGVLGLRVSATAAGAQIGGGRNAHLSLGPAVTNPRAHFRYGCARPILHAARGLVLFLASAPERTVVSIAHCSLGALARACVPPKCPCLHWLSLARVQGGIWGAPLVWSWPSVRGFARNIRHLGGKRGPRHTLTLRAISALAR